MQFDFQNSPTVKAINAAGYGFNIDALEILQVLDEYATPEERAAVKDLADLITLYGTAFNRRIKAGLDYANEQAGAAPAVSLSDFSEVVSALDAADAEAQAQAPQDIVLH